VVVYFCGIMIFHGAGITFGLPSQIVYSVSFLIAFTELYSISENIKSITGVNLATTILRFFRRTCLISVSWQFQKFVVLGGFRRVIFWERNWGSGFIFMIAHKLLHGK
jgi:hypothetical protein